MRGEQLFLFPELDPFKTLIRNVDYVDLSTLTLGDDNRKNLLSNLPQGAYFIYKTGGFNKYLPNLGNVFPYIKNENTGRIGLVYPNIKMHRIAGEAFVINDDPLIKKLVDHKNKNRLDYRVSNLRWVTASQNNMGTVRTFGKSYEDKLYLDPLAPGGNKSPKT
mgnify:CR=1 FL=1